MSSISFRASQIRCHCEAPHPVRDDGPLHSLHVHGSIGIRVDDAECIIPSDDFCLNGFSAALAMIRDHVAFGTRKLDPTTYHLRAPKPAPLLEFLRMNDNVRVAALFDGEGDSTVVSVTEIQQSVDAFLKDLLNAVSAHRREDVAVEEQEFFAPQCDVFRCARAAQAPPVWLESATDPARTVDLNAPPVLCIRIADMNAARAAGSLRGQCGQCGSPVWIAPSSRVIIEERSSPVYCIQCFSP